FQSKVTVVLSIGGSHPIIHLIIERLFVDKDGSDVGTGKYSSLQGNHSKVLSRQELTPIFRVIYLTGLHIHHSDAPVFVELSAETGSKVDGHTQPNATREKGT